VWLCALFVGTVLAIVAYIVNWAVTLAILTGILMFSVVQVSRRARKDRARIENRLARAARDRETIIEVLFGVLGLRDMNMRQSGTNSQPRRRRGVADGAPRRRTFAA